MQSHRATRWPCCCRSCTTSTAMKSRTGLPVVVSTRSATFGRHVRHPRVHVPHRHVVVVRSNSLNTLTTEFDRCLRNMRCLQKSSMVSAFCAYAGYVSSTLQTRHSRHTCMRKIALVTIDGSSRSDSCVGLLFQPMCTICLQLTSPRRHGGVAHAHAGDAHYGRTQPRTARRHFPWRRCISTTIILLHWHPSHLVLQTWRDRPR